MLFYLWILLPVKNLYATGVIETATLAITYVKATYILMLQYEKIGKWLKHNLILCALPLALICRVNIY